MARAAQIQLLQTGLRQRGQVRPPLPGKPPTPQPAVPMGVVGPPLPAYQRAIHNLKSSTKTPPTPPQDKNQIGGGEEAITAFQNFGETTAQFIRQLAGKAKEKATNAPTPGSVWLPLGILLALMLVLIPVNGHTRLTWLWLALTQQAHIGAPQAPVSPGNTLIQQPGVTGVGTQFGGSGGSENPYVAENYQATQPYNSHLGGSDW